MLDCLLDWPDTDKRAQYILSTVHFCYLECAAGRDSPRRIALHGRRSALIVTVATYTDGRCVDTPANAGCYGCHGSSQEGQEIKIASIIRS